MLFIGKKKELKLEIILPNYVLFVFRISMSSLSVLLHMEKNALTKKT